jgi:phosphoadenosine phosphosulfate reductase
MHRSIDVRALIDLIERELAAGTRACLTSSFQADCVVLIDLVRRVRPDIPVLFLDTVHHFPATYRYRDALAARWRLNLVTLRADVPSPGLWQTSVDACCARHKVEPLFSALESYDVWFTALRRDQSPTRAGVRTTDSFALPSGHALRKVSPLADWSMDDVVTYLSEREIPLLPLYTDGYTSIGCEPCTSLPSGADARSGRWSGRKLECGIHIGASGAVSRGTHDRTPS